MKALCWLGKHKLGVETVADPKILNPGDAIVKITTTAICGSDLHLYAGLIPTLKEGDILGHEFMGIVEEVGPEVTRLKVGDRVVVPFTISCGRCYFCQHDLWSLCDNSNPNATELEKIAGYSTAGLFGYSHLYGGYAGGQAQYARVPFADYGPIKIESDLDDEQVLFLSDIFPTGYMAAENCNIKPGDVVAVWGCGPVGQFTIRSAYLQGAEKVIAIDDVPERMQMAEQGGAHVVLAGDDVREQLNHATGGRGPDACVDAVGMESHGSTYDAIKQTLKLETDRPYALRQAIMACRKGGTVSIPGVYGGLLDKMPFGAAIGKGLTFKMGQTHCQKYLRPLLELIAKGSIDPSFVITHRVPLSDAPKAYEIFAKKEDKCIKVVLKPWENDGNESAHSNGNGNGNVAPRSARHLRKTELPLSALGLLALTAINGYTDGAMADPFNLQRFVEAQAPVWEDVCAELKAGEKQSHWMWFVFPQLQGLGRSWMAKKFAIASLEEAAAYLAHPLLGPRLREATGWVNAVQGRAIRQILGPPDDLKFRSCLTLFTAATSENAVFLEGLRQYFGGEGDPLTAKLLPPRPQAGPSFV